MSLSNPLTSDQINTLRNQSDIVGIFMFGSQVIDRAGPLSDTDLGIILSKPFSLDQNLKKTVELELYLTQLFSQFKNIQITILNTAPIGLQLDALTHGQSLFVADKKALADFREYIMRRAGDLRPFLRAFRSERLRSSYA